MTKPGPVLVSVEEAAEMLRVSRATFYKLLNSGAVRAVKNGRRTLIPMQALRDYAESLSSYAPASGDRSPAPELVAFVQALARAAEARDWNEARRQVDAICQELEAASELVRLPR